MLSTSPMQTAKRCVASLATAGLLIAGFAGSASAATVDQPSAVVAASSSTDTTSMDMFPTDDAAPGCRNINVITDRPTVTQSACIVPKGHALLEAGYNASKDQQTGTNSYVYPQATLRFGTDIKNLEISVTGPSESRVKPTSGQSYHALGDSAIGAKYYLGGSKRFAQSIAAGLTIPTGDNGNTTNTNTPNLEYNASYALTKVFGLAATENFIANAFKPAATPLSGNPPTTRYGSFQTSLVLSAAVPKIANVFVEDAVASHNLGSGTSANQFMGGLSKAFTQRLLIDAEYTTGTQHISGGPTSKAHGFGAGLSYLL